jgi:hypothetical protein
MRELRLEVGSRRISILDLGEELGEAPSIRVSEDEGSPVTFQADRSVTEPLFAAASRAGGSLAPGVGMLGVGGTLRKLSYESGFISAHFQWWQEAPEGWETLESLAVELEVLMHRHIGDYPRRSE